MNMRISYWALALALGWSQVSLAGSSRSPDLTIVTDAEQSKSVEAQKEKEVSRAADTASAPAANAIGKPPRESLELLRQGNQRFIDAKMTAPRRDEKTRTEVSTGQHPFAIVLSCSDSRV
ncbi:hypothetical protein EBU99_00550, partial [bacterium]|nr:hypothetical protein [bacterium]